MSTVLISVPQIPYTAVTFEAYDDDNNVLAGLDWGLVTDWRAGARGSHYAVDTEEFTTSDGIVNIDIDLGTSYLAKNNTADHLILSRADFLRRQGVTDLELFYSDDGSSYTSVIAISDLDTRSLDGNREQDLLLTFTETTGHRYWRLHIEKSSAYTCRFSKLQIGKWIDLGVDPEFETDLVELDSTPFFSDSGAEFRASLDSERIRVILDYIGVTDTNLDKWIWQAAKFQSIGQIYLYAPDQPQILGGHTLVPVTIQSASYGRIGDVENYNQLSATFVEAIG